MPNDVVFYTIFVIFAGAALLSTLVLYTRQSILVAYIILGAALGPWGFNLIPDIEIVRQVGDIGIVFLLFLLGLHLQPQNLVHMLGKISIISLVSSVLFAGVGYFVGCWFGLNATEAWVLAGAMMFSSTIIGLKLLPTTILHHQHTGEVMIGILLLQDVIAIIVLILINGAQDGNGLTLDDLVLILLALPCLTIGAFVFERKILMRLFARFDRTQEYLFLVSIAWCLSLSYIAHAIGLSEDIGAFIAGVAIASSPISLFIAESLKPLRDFFLVLFFFAVGAVFNFGVIAQVLIPTLILTAMIVLLKPLVFSHLLRFFGERSSVANEVGVRLGQGSEFSLLIGGIAFATKIISEPALNLIQATTILSFIISSYWVVLVYPTPLAISQTLQKD